MQYPILYKLTNTGATQYWKTWTTGNQVHTEFGQLGTDKPQHTMDEAEGKNLGKKNETTNEQQAIIQAKQNWDKHIKKGYVESLEQAQSGDTGLEGIKPMLAQKYEDREKEINEALTKSKPILVQPKLDGIRCVAICTEGKVKLYTRTQKLINTVPHIIEQLEEFSNRFTKPNFILDGELYCHKFSDNFNEFISIVKRDELHPNHEVIEYHIYDIPSSSKDTKDRLHNLIQLGKVFESYQLKNLITVETKAVSTVDQIGKDQAEYIDQGYEGLMIRLDGPYENKRSKYLLKFKNFQDSEYKIIGIEEGNGKLMGHVGSFICETPEGKQFNCKLKGKLSDLKYHFENADKVLGKMLTVQYFELTPDSIPRFPVGIAIRDYE